LEEGSSPKTGRFAGTELLLQKLSDVKLTDKVHIETSLKELGRVLGGGLVPGSVVFIGGDPCIGKSTILLQYMCKLSESLNAIYVTGEESAQQISMRAKRREKTIVENFNN
jgi:DNA repair protein RadA/Sms